MPSSRAITRVPAPAPKCNVISRCIRRMVSLLVGIPHSVRCNGAVDASAMLTCQAPPLPGRPSHAGGRLRQNGGRLQIGMLDGIRSEWWAPSDQNAWTASLGICTTPQQHSNGIPKPSIEFEPTLRNDPRTLSVRVEGVQKNVRRLRHDRGGYPKERCPPLAKPSVAIFR